jgi:tetratricopeptide (TPR) repeat protein
LREVRIAEELDPLSIPVNQIAGTIMYFQRMYHDAVERFQRVLDIEPKAALAQNNLGLAQFEEGGVEEGLAAIKKALEMDPKNMMFRADLCYALCRAGRRSEAMDVLHRAESQVNSEHISPIAISGMYASLGDNDRAIEWLEKAYEEHSPYLASLRVERWFEKIRQDQRFVAILKRLRLID